MKEQRIISPTEKKLPKRLYSIEDAAVYLSISPWTVRSLIHNGKLKRVSFSRRVLIDKADLDKLIDSNKECFTF